MQTRPIEERGDVKNLGVGLRGWNFGSWYQDQFGLSTMDLILKTGSSIKGHFGPSMVYHILKSGTFIKGQFVPSTVDLTPKSGSSIQR